MKTAAEDAGFSLLEVLVALAIVSLATTLLVVNVPHWLDRQAFAAVLASLDEARSFAGAEARRSGYPTMLTVSPGSLLVRTYGRARRWELPGSAHLTVTSAQEFERDGKPAIAFFADGTSSGADVKVRVGRHEEDRHLRWLAHGAYDAR